MVKMQFLKVGLSVGNRADSCESALKYVIL